MFALNMTSSMVAQPNVNSKLLDDCLYRIATKKSKDALAELYKETSAGLYSYAFSILKNSHDAEDILQDCYLRIFASAYTYRSSGKPLAWMYSIVKNLCLHRFREKERESDIPEEDWENFLEEKEDISKEDKMVIRECMQILSDEERQIVVLHAVAGFKHREIAVITELPLSTVLSKYNRAIKKLKTALQKGDFIYG